jgi:MFS family permease
MPQDPDSAMTCTDKVSGRRKVRDTYLVGALLAVMSFLATPANATLFAAQIDITPPELQGRVVSTAMLAAGIAAPVGPPLAGLLLDSGGQALTFFLFAALGAALTIVMHLNSTVRTMHRPGTGPKQAGCQAAESPQPDSPS